MRGTIVAVSTAAEMTPKGVRVQELVLTIRFRRLSQAAFAELQAQDGQTVEVYPPILRPLRERKKKR